MLKKNKRVTASPEFPSENKKLKLMIKASLRIRK